METLDRPLCHPRFLKGELLAAVGQAAIGQTVTPHAGKPRNRPQTADAITSFDKAGIAPGDEAGAPKSRKGLIAIAAVLLLALGGLGVFLATQSGDQPAAKEAAGQPVASAAGAISESSDKDEDKTDEEGGQAASTDEADGSVTATQDAGAVADDAGAIAGDALAQAAADTAAAGPDTAKAAEPADKPTEAVVVAPPPVPVVEI